MDAVFFDIDDTLYDQAQPLAHAVRVVLGALPAGASAGELYVASRRHSGEVFAAYGRGGHPTDDIYIRRMRETLADFGVSITDDQALRLQRAYTSKSAGAMELHPEMAATMSWCSAHASRGVGVITNGSPRMQRAKLRALGCDRWVPDDHVFISEELDLAKPDPRLFWHACEVVGVEPEDSLFIGDAYAVDVVGAHAAGMPVVWFNRRNNPVPEGPDAVRADWLVHSERELLDLVRTIV